MNNYHCHPCMEGSVWSLSGVLGHSPLKPHCLGLGRVDKAFCKILCECLGLVSNQRTREDLSLWKAYAWKWSTQRAMVGWQGSCYKHQRVGRCFVNLTRRTGLANEISPPVRSWLPHQCHRVPRARSTSQCGNPSRYLVLEKCIQAPPLPCSEWDVGICADKVVVNETEKSFLFASLYSLLVLALRSHDVCDLHLWSITFFFLSAKCVVFGCC